MGILDNLPSSNAPTASQARAGTNNRSDRPQAKVWMNVGYEANGRFVNLPIGQAIDTMEPADVRGQNEDWIKFQTARNQLLKALQEEGAKLQPGQEIELPMLVIKLRRTNEAVEVNNADNEYAVDLASMFAR